MLAFKGSRRSSMARMTTASDARFSDPLWGGEPGGFRRGPVGREASFRKVRRFASAAAGKKTRQQEGKKAATVSWGQSLSESVERIALRDTIVKQGKRVNGSSVGKPGAEEKG